MKKQKINYAFFVVCKMDNASHHKFISSGRVEKETVLETLKSCLRGIRKHHPSAKVFIIDSNSDDQTYHKHVEGQFNVKVDYAKNKNYTVGAVKYVFENYKDYEFYYFIQDSQVVCSNLEDLLCHELTTYSYFNSHRGMHRSKSGREYGFGWPGNIELGDAWLEKYTSIKKIPDAFTGCWGSIMYCRQKVLEDLNNAGYFNMLPSNKQEDQLMERITGIVLEDLGYDLKKSTLRGTNRLAKKFRARK